MDTAGEVRALRDHAPGEWVGHKYRIIDVLGTGGIATTCLAEDRRERQVALKQLFLWRRHDWKAFEHPREARIAGEDRETVFERARSDPEVVGRDGVPRLLSAAHSSESRFVSRRSSARLSRLLPENPGVSALRSMVHRILRLAIVPERAPDVRRVIDFDGRHTLHDVHLAIQHHLSLDDDHLYSFFMSGRYWDRTTEIGAPRSVGAAPRADRSLLFRLGLRPGQRFVYLFDFGAELRHELEVLDITEVPTPLAEPRLVESTGEAPLQEGGPDDMDDVFDDDASPDASEDVDEDERQEEGAEDPTLAPLLPLAERATRVLDECDAEGHPPAEALDDAFSAALELADALRADPDLIGPLDGRTGLMDALDELPGMLLFARRDEEALTLCDKYAPFAPEIFLCARAHVLAVMGRDREARRQIDENVRTFGEDYLVWLDTADTYQVLGEDTESELIYRRMLEHPEPTARAEALARLVLLLEDQGRADELAALTGARIAGPSPTPALKVGRNEPCPCGSGRKHKKCCAQAA